jgi:hypothetical protein
MEEVFWLKMLVLLYFGLDNIFRAVEKVEMDRVYLTFVKVPYPHTMDIVGMAIHQVVCQKSDFHGNSDFQNSRKLDPLQKTAKKSGQNMLAFQRYFGAIN